MRIPVDHPLLARWGPPVASALIRGLFGTVRKTLEGDPQGVHLFQSPEPVIFALWHGHLLSALSVGRIFARKKPGIVILTSPSRDGEFIAAVARHLGYLTVSGSRQKGGVRALKRLALYLGEGLSAAIVADGSRGPAHVVQKGVVFLARETHLPILPLAAALRWKVTLNTWDRFEIPLPGNRCALLVGPPLVIPAEARGGSLETCRMLLEERLNALFSESRRHFPA